MKKMSIHLAISSLLWILACSTAGSASSIKSAGGSWTVNSVSYQAVVCAANMYGNAGTLTAQNQAVATSAGSYSLLVCSFYKALPVTSGTYTVINGNKNPSAANQVGFVANVNGFTGTGYASTGGKGHETVTVTVAGGKVSIAGTGITMAIPAKSSNSTTLSLNITQTQ